MDRLLATQRQSDPKSRRHHYVPQTYLRKWGFDQHNKRIWNLDTITKGLNAYAIKDVCVSENFYRVVGPTGEAHNRVEAMFAVADSELGRIQNLFNKLEDPDELEYDDLIALGTTVAVQRMRTAQQRRLQLQFDAWLVAQSPDQFTSMNDPEDPLRVSGIHTELLFRSMWEAADVMTTRSIEIWHDPKGRFWTCDTPVLVPFQNNRRHGLLGAPYILWPISPHRVIALTNEPSGEKAVIREVTPKERGLLKKAVEQGRERWIFASPDQKSTLPKSKLFNRRTQIQLACSPWTPEGEEIEPPGCCVEWFEGISSGPGMALCGQGLHREAPEVMDYI